MTVPICSLHGVPMKASSRGSGFYCSQKLADGTYCKEKNAGPAAPATTNGAVPSGDVLAAASLYFAAHVWGAIPPEMHDEAIGTAIKACKAMKAIS